jgi:hypothetical protein
MQKLTFDECPKTREGFLKRWREDRVFRARAQYTGFDVLWENVILPNDKVVGVKVK